MPRPPNRRPTVVQHYRIDSDPGKLRATLVSMRRALPALDQAVWRRVQRVVVAQVARAPKGTRLIELDVQLFDDSVRLEANGGAPAAVWTEIDRYPTNNRAEVSR